MFKLRYVHKLKQKLETGNASYTDILSITKKPSLQAAEILEEIASDFDRTNPEIGHHWEGAALGHWADIVIIYCREGSIGLEKMIQRNDRVGFIFEMLGELPVTKAVPILIQISKNSSQLFRQDIEYGTMLIGALSRPMTRNNILMLHRGKRIFRWHSPIIYADRVFKEKIPSHQISYVRNYLHAFLEIHHTNPNNISWLCFSALRFYGDKSSLKVLGVYPDTRQDLTERSRKLAIKYIRRRMNIFPLPEIHFHSRII